MCMWRVAHGHHGAHAHATCNIAYRNSSRFPHRRTQHQQARSTEWRHVAVRQNLGRSDTFSQTRTAYHADAADVRPRRPQYAVPTDHNTGCGHSQKRRPGSVVVNLQVVHRPLTANILCVNMLAVECRTRPSLHMERVHRGHGTCKRCALEPIPRRRPYTATYHCRVSCLGCALRQLAAADLVDRRGEDAAGRCRPSPSSGCCHGPRRARGQDGVVRLAACTPCAAR